MIYWFPIIWWGIMMSLIIWWWFEWLNMFIFFPLVIWTGNSINLGQKIILLKHYNNSCLATNTIDRLGITQGNDIFQFDDRTSRAVNVMKRWSVSEGWQDFKEFSFFFHKQIYVKIQQNHFLTWAWPLFTKSIARRPDLWISIETINIHLIQCINWPLGVTLCQFFSLFQISPFL